jgi:minor histocompatibility antigen H13
MKKIWPHSLIKNEKYDIHFHFKNVTDSAKNISIIEVGHFFDRQIILCFILSLCFGTWYFLKKHWIANNIFGLAFAVNGIEFLQLNKILNGCILLGGLFLYDIFWVFGTDVMVSVAKSFDAPIKLIFPQDLIEHGIEADKFALLGLGDIVIPGIFIALLLRFDMSLNRNSRTYFNAAFAAYVIALVACIVVMHVFKHAQVKHLL